ncbi:MAG: HAD family hydrolase [Chloroflexota bacterium]|nr:HAD family hydrolase [Chloroflexota bacterium]
MTAAVFLDRDGSLNVKAPEGRYITGWGQFELLPGVDAALRELRRRDPGARIVVTTNQRGVARGLIDRASLDDLHARMLADLKRAGVELDGVYVCPHDADACGCRKPEPGLLRQAVADFPEIEPERSALIGDSLADLEAAQRFGCAAYLVGPPDRRRVVMAGAASRGVPVAGEAASLAALLRAYPITGSRPETGQRAPATGTDTGK